MHYQTLPNTIGRAAVGILSHRMGLGSVPDAVYRTEKPSSASSCSSLSDVARLCVENAPPSAAANWSSCVDVAGRALTTSDFANILSDVGNKQLQSAYTSHPPSFALWASVGSLPNFKPAQICRVSAPGLLPELLGDDEYRMLTLEDGSERVRLKTFGGLLSISRQTVVNDDLDALADTNRLLAQSAALTQSMIAVDALAGSHNLSDGTAVFATDRNNLLTGLDSVLDAGSLGLAVATMRRFSDSNGQPLSIEPKFLIVPPELERVACQLCYSDADPSCNHAGTLNIFKRNGLQVVVEPLLTSAKSWYLLPDQALVPFVRYFTLFDGGLIPHIESRQGFSTDNLELKVRVDFAAAPIGYFAVKSTGE